MRKFAHGLVILGVLVLAAACGRGSAGKETRVARGDQFLSEGKLAEALIEYQAAVQLDGRDGRLRHKLGSAYARAGDPGRALQQVVRAADLLPDDPDVQLDAAKALLLAGRSEDASTRAQQVLRKDPKNVRALVLRAGADAGMRESDDAIVSLQEAIRLDPKRAATYIDLATLQATQHKPEAEAGFKQAIVVAPKSIEARLALANYYWLTGRRKEAEQSVLDAVAIDGRDVRANMVLAGIYNLTGRAAEAEAPLKRVVEGSDSLEPRLTLADYYVGRRRLDDARKILEELAKRKEAAAAARSRLAGIEYDSGRHDVAHKQIDALISEQPANSQILVLKGNWRLLENRPGDALELARAALKLEPRSGDALNLLGSVHAARNEVDEAIKAFTEALQEQPRGYNAAIMLANLNIARGRPDDAVAFATQAVRSAPNAATRHALARALFADGRVDQALSQLTPVIAAVPDSADALTLLGRIQQSKGDLRAARATFARVLVLAPASAEALTGLVNLELAERRTEAAVKLVEAHSTSHPADPKVLLVVGRTYAAVGDLARAEASLRKAIDADPTLFQAYTALGQVFIRQKKLAEAQRTFEERLQQNPRDVAANTMVGLLLYVQGKPAEAKARFEQTLSIDPRAAVAANNLAYMDAEAGTNLEVALNRAQVAKVAQPDDPDFNDTLGWVYVKRGLPALSVAPLEQAIQKDPSNPLYHYHLGVAYAKSGDNDRARPELIRALQLSPNFEKAADAKRLLETLGK